jgi:hypothetical protein
LARNMGSGAMTAHSFVMKHVLHGTFGGDAVLIDEISFMSLDLLAALEQVRLRANVRIICFGDFAQLPPVTNRWRGHNVPPDAFEKSRMFWQWSDGTRFVLTRCRRSDQEHFDFYTSSPSLVAARSRYPARCQDADWNICLSNAKRRRLNTELQRKAAENVLDVSAAKH